MEISVTTPALLFPAISLLLLAYTNRFVVVANRIRDLHSRYRTTSEEVLVLQIENLRKRVFLIRNMQAVGILSMFLTVMAMFVLFGGAITLGKWIFGASLVLLMVSLAISFWEIQMSTGAITLELSDLEFGEKRGRGKVDSD
jgi:hypothetical protein